MTNPDAINEKTQKQGKTYKKRYRMNAVGKDGSTTTVALPPHVITRKAEEMGLTPEEFVERHRVIAHYNNFDGVYYSFEGISED